MSHRTKKARLYCAYSDACGVKPGVVFKWGGNHIFATRCVTRPSYRCIRGGVDPGGGLARHAAKCGHNDVINVVEGAPGCHRGGVRGTLMCETTVRVPGPEPGEPSMSEIVRVAKISQPMTATHLAGTAGKGRPRGVVIHFDALPAPIARIRTSVPLPRWTPPPAARTCSQQIHSGQSRYCRLAYEHSADVHLATSQRTVPGECQS